jgi:O-acetyl-ADP-ribose deacetylase (regulator of RNase III)
MARIEIVQGDITTRRVDAVVNAANSSLMGGGGVDGAIHRAGGPAILAECQEVRASQWPDGLPTGEAVATTAGELAASWVIHTVGPIYAQEADPAALLAACHRRALEVAVELQVESVAFPAISCGVYGYPLHEAAPIAINTVSDSGFDGLVEFVLFDSAAHSAFQRTAEPR